MSDIITTLHPEGASEDDLYPNIKKENLPSNLQTVADFALSEYEKTLNLWDEVWEVGGISDTTGEEISGTSIRRSANLIKVKPSTVYHFLWNSFTTGSVISIGIYQYDVNGVFISGSAIFHYTGERDFTTLSNCEYIKFRIYNSEWAASSTPTLDIIISEGAQNVGFHHYNGRIAHIVDVEGVKLWENGNPNSPLAPVTLNFDSTRYRYLVIEMKPLINDTYSRQYMKCRNVTGYAYLSESSAGTDYDREIYIVGGTGIEIRGGYINATASNDACIVTAIYGVE